MEPVVHDIGSLFAQLGLPSDEASIEAFIAEHAPVPKDIKLHEAAFWTPAQSAFLREEILEDADWAEPIDDLNVRLRKVP